MSLERWREILWHCKFQITTQNMFGFAKNEQQNEREENHKRSSAICNSMQFQMSLSFTENHIKSHEWISHRIHAILPVMTFQTLKAKDIISSVSVESWIHPSKKLLIEIIFSTANRLQRRNPLIYIFAHKLAGREEREVFKFSSSYKLYFLLTNWH